MRTFLGMLLVLMVSGDDQVTINGYFGGSVLLPCNCTDRNLNEEFLWQKEGSPNTLVLKPKGNTSSVEFCDGHKGKIFLCENKENCSLFLTNITAKDQGIYRCKFYIGEQYNRSFVNLTVSAPAPALSPPSSELQKNQNDKDTLTAVPPLAHSQDRRHLSLIIIPIVLVLGLSLLLWHRWNSSQRLQRIREVETDNF